MKIEVDNLHELVTKYGQATYKGKEIFFYFRPTDPSNCMFYRYAGKVFVVEGIGSFTRNGTTCPESIKEIKQKGIKKRKVELLVLSLLNGTAGKFIPGVKGLTISRKAAVELIDSYLTKEEWMNEELPADVSRVTDRFSCIEDALVYNQERIDYVSSLSH